MQEELARGASSEQRSVEDCHQLSHLVKMSSKDVKKKKVSTPWQSGKGVSTRRITESAVIFHNCNYS